MWASHCVTVSLKVPWTFLYLRPKTCKVRVLVSISRDCHSKLNMELKILKYWYNLVMKARLWMKYDHVNLWSVYYYVYSPLLLIIYCKLFSSFSKFSDNTVFKVDTPYEQKPQWRFCFETFKTVYVCNIFPHKLSGASSMFILCSQKLSLFVML